MGFFAQFGQCGTLLQQLDVAKNGSFFFHAAFNWGPTLTGTMGKAMGLMVTALLGRDSAAIKLTKSI